LYDKPHSWKKVRGTAQKTQRAQFDLL
jgi:protein tyrosine phosphatase